MILETVPEELVPYLEKQVTEYQEEIENYGDDDDLAGCSADYRRGCRDMADHILAYVQNHREERS